MLKRRQVWKSVVAKKVRVVARVPAIWASSAGARAENDEFVVVNAGRWVEKVVRFCIARMAGGRMTSIAKAFSQGISLYVTLRAISI